MAFDSGKTGAQILAGLMPTGGTDGQALRKLGASAEWSAYWVVDPTTGGMSSTLPDDATPITPGVTPIPLMLSAEVKLTDANVPVGSGVDRKAVLKVSASGNFSLTTSSDYYGIPPSTQSGYGNTQIGYNNTQSGNCNTQSGYGNTQSGSCNTQSGASNTQIGYNNTQSGNYNTQSGSCNTQSGIGNTQIGYNNTQSGSSNTQSGNYNTQIGYGNTQSGASNTQSGYNNTQSGNYGAQSGGDNAQSGSYGTQSGKSLNDGGFDYAAMFGNTKTATIGDRAYFALDNGIWLKPVAGDAASPENGVICYNATTHKFRGYANGAWVDLH